MFTTWSKITQVYNLLQENWKGKLKANMNTHRHTQTPKTHNRLCGNSELSSDSPHGYAWDTYPASYVWWVLRPLPPPCTPALHAPAVLPAAATCGCPPSDTTACWWNSYIHPSRTLLTKNDTKLTFFEQGIYWFQALYFYFYYNNNNNNLVLSHFSMSSNRDLTASLSLSPDQRMWPTSARYERGLLSPN